jgi:hypothetical protein
MDNINVLNKHQLCGYELMLSDAQTSVLSIVDSCVSYRNKYKHYRCFSCGLYGHIAADCKNVCKECSGKHLQSHCIVKLVKIINDIFDTMSHDFVKDYNRLKAKVNKLLNPVIVQHKEPLQFVQGEDVSIIDKPKIEKQLVQIPLYVNLDLENEFKKLSFMERFVLRPKYNTECVHDLCENAIRQEISKRCPDFLNYKYVYEFVHSTTYSASLIVEAMQQKELSGKCHITIGNLRAHNCVEKEDTKALVTKLKAFDSLVKPFNQLQHISNVINNKQHKLDDIKNLVKVYADKVCQLKQKYIDKKANMMRELHQKAKVEFMKAYHTTQLKKQVLERKIENMKARLDLAYAFGPRTKLGKKKEAVFNASNNQFEQVETDVTVLSSLASLGITPCPKSKNRGAPCFSITCWNCLDKYQVTFEQACNVMQLSCSHCRARMIDNVTSQDKVREFVDRLQCVFKTLAEQFPQAFNLE